MALQSNAMAPPQTPLNSQQGIETQPCYMVPGHFQVKTFLPKWSDQHQARETVSPIILKT